MNAKLAEQTGTPGLLPLRVDRRPPVGNALSASPASPLVTVIVAVYNGASTLTRALDSVRAQDYPNLELLVVDGGSKDGTVELLQQRTDLDLWLSEPDRGVYDAWNKGLAEARGEWIAFLGSDDIYTPGAISAYVQAAANGTELEYMASQVLRVAQTGYTRIVGGPWEWQSFRRYMTTAHVGSLHHRRLFARVGTFNSSYRSAGDYELLLRAGPSLRAGFLPEVTAVMQGGGTSDSTLSLKETLRAQRTMGALPTWRAYLEYMLATAKFHGRRWRG